MSKISKIFAVLAAAFAPCLGFANAVLAQVNHAGAVSTLFPPDVNRPCAFFILQGVTQADPAVGTAPWFAIPMTHVGFHEQYALLLTATANNHPIAVTTSGQPACGFAGVNYLWSNFP